MRSILTIGINTYREAIRDKILYMFLAFAVILIIGSRFISMLTVGDPAKIIIDIGMSAIQIFSMLIAVMMSVILIARDFDNRTIFTILSKPVARGTYLLGKFTGLVAITLTMTAFMSLAVFLIIIFYGAGLNFHVFLGGFMTMLEMLVLCAFAVLFATVSKPILGSILTLAAFFLGHITAGLMLLPDRFQEAFGQFFNQQIVPVLYYILPNLEVFNFKAVVVHSLAVEPAAVFWAILYCAIYSSILLTLAWFFFKGKDVE